MLRCVEEFQGTIMILEEIHFVFLQPSTSVNNQVNQHSQATLCQPKDGKHCWKYYFVINSNNAYAV